MPYIKGVPFLICNTCKRPLLTARSYGITAPELESLPTCTPGSISVLGHIEFKWHAREVSWSLEKHRSVRGFCENCRTQFFIRFAETTIPVLLWNINEGWEIEHNWIDGELLDGQLDSFETDERSICADYKNCHIARFTRNGSDLGPQRLDRPGKQEDERDFTERRSRIQARALAGIEALILSRSTPE